MWSVALATVVFAGPADDPTALLAGRAARSTGEPVLLGASDRSPLSLAWTLRAAGVGLGAEEEPGALSALLAAERRVVAGQARWTAPSWVVRPHGALSLGDLEPEGGGGEAEPGLVTARARAEGRFYAGPWEAALAPELGLDLFPWSPEARLAEAWAGVHTDVVTAGFGLRDRWIGPGRHGSLMLTDHARPAPLGSVALQSPTQRGGWGPARIEVGLGWLDGERGDVTRPGWLLMDLRWAARSWLEIGGTRMSIFGGQGRPPPDPLQLLVPTEPHVYDDPDQLLPDQNELAALDLRVTVPVGRLARRAGADSRVDYLELWWQYGGEDVIARESLGLPYPSLAGVANLFGAEIGAGPLTVSAEGARLLDDVFRWYTGHRIYHEGFTRDGRAMGHPAGGDSVSAWGAVTWLPGDWGAQLQVERRRRVGVVEASGDNLLALSADELRHRVGLGAWRRDAQGWWRLLLQVEQVQAEDFVPGADGWGLRLSISR